MSDAFVKIDSPIPDVVVVTLNRPEKRNALSLKMMQELHGAIVHHAQKCRVLILTANGPVFCAGLDLHEASDPKLVEETSQAIASLFQVIEASPCITLCAIQGDVLAGGVGLMMAVDFALMVEGARLSFPEVKKGIVPALVAVMLKRQIAMRHVRELLLFGQQVSAMRAYEMGLVNRVVAKEKMLDETFAFAQLAVQGGKDAIRELKKLFLDLEPLAPQMQLALEVHRKSRAGSEAKRGIQIFTDDHPRNA